MAKTVIDLKDNLLQKAVKLTGMTKKVELVNYALESLIRQKEMEAILDLKGKVEWQGDLEDMRRNRIGLSG